MTTREARMTRWHTIAYAAWGIIGIVLLIVAVTWALMKVSGALAPFILAFLFVFALQRPVGILAARGLPRGWAVAFTFLVGISVATVFVVFVAPFIGAQMVSFAKAVPELYRQATVLIEGSQEQFSGLLTPGVRDAALSVGQSLSDVAVRIGNSIAEGIVTAGGGIATVVFDIFIAAVIAFWTLKDLPKIRRELRTLAGDKYEDDLENLLTTIGRMVGGYLKGQTIASLVTGVAAGIMLALIGVPFAAVCGMLTFIFNFVPYIGPFFAGLIAGTLGLFAGGSGLQYVTAILAVVIVIAAQNLTDIFVTPRVMSDQVDLHPTLVIFSLLMGGAVFGFWGLIFSIPVAATLKALFVYYWERRTRRQLATEDGALFRMPPCDEDTEEPCAAAGENGDAEKPGDEPREGAST